MKEFNGNIDDFISFLNGGKKPQKVDGLEFLISCQQKLKGLSGSNYVQANPYIGIYFNAIKYIKNIYENPSLDTIKKNYGNLKKLIKKYETIDIETAADKVIAYADEYRNEAKQLKEALFHPASTKISHSFGNESKELLKGALYYSIFDQINQLFNEGTFGCVLNDALNKFPSRQRDVIEELSRLKDRLGFIDGEIVCAELNDYNVNSWQEEELEE